jgi:hypothetical protein
MTEILQLKLQLSTYNDCGKSVLYYFDRPIKNVCINISNLKNKYNIETNFVILSCCLPV